jgi:AraC-like DNA-binding protein
MSVRVMALVWKLDLPASHKIVVLKCADYADDSGRGIYPTQKTLARECGLSQRQVRRALEDAVGTRLLVVEVEHDPVRRKPAVYAFDMDELARRTADSESAALRPESPQSGDKESTAQRTERPHPVASQSAALRPESPPEPSNESTKEPPVQQPPPAGDDDGAGLDVAMSFLELRKRLWPNADPPAAKWRLIRQARTYLADAPAELLKQEIERQMRKDHMHGERIPAMLDAYRLSILNAIASYRSACGLSANASRETGGN